ncbi:hypothetical protein ACSHWO_37400 (plasmid) [Streptomyces sp. HUAS TT3]|uniref:hypothetical protein n=1 Tax=Streptomyces sp. HUAS TT3 TaxID=3447510 RepID=UPI003F65FBFE
MVTLVPFKAEHLTTADVDRTHLERMVPPRPLEPVEIVVLVDRDHAAPADDALSGK